MRIKLFAQLKDVAGKDEIDLQLERPLTVHQVMDLVSQAEPRLAPLLRTTKVVVNMEILSGQRQIEEHDEVALLPPFSGG